MSLLHKKRDYLLAPIYYAQARHVAKTTLRLPEPDGVRVARLGAQGQPALRLAIFGDSAAAGVGVDSQDDAPFGRIGSLLGDDFDVHHELHATSGHTSGCLLHRLYAMPAAAYDVAVISIGVNDVIKQTSDRHWTQNLHDIIAILQRKFGVHDVLFLSLPPMQLAPSLPTPLNELIGRRVAMLSRLMQACCELHAGVHYVKDEFKQAEFDKAVMFAKDGFHPSKTTYDVWAHTLANHIKALYRADNCAWKAG